MATATTVNGVERLENFMKAVGGTAKEWYVGISHDAVGRLEQHGMLGNPYAEWIQCDDEKTARAIEEYLLNCGTQGDTGGGKPDKPPTQVYVFRAPKLTSFREWLKAEEKKKEGDEGKRREKRQEWVEAANRLIGRCHAWLTEADTEGILNLRISTNPKAETGLGRYETNFLVVEHEEAHLHIVPFGRNTTRVLSLVPGVEIQTQGRADISNGIEKWMLYRVHVDGQERWYATPDRGDPVEFNQNVFMAIMEDLLS